VLRDSLPHFVDTDVCMVFEHATQGWVTISRGCRKVYNPASKYQTVLKISEHNADKNPNETQANCKYKKTPHEQPNMHLPHRPAMSTNPLKNSNSVSAARPSFAKNPLEPPAAHHPSPDSKPTLAPPQRYPSYTSKVPSPYPPAS
jgi:hypothetical protein